MKKSGSAPTVFFCAVLISAVTACAGRVIDAKELFESTCSRCHSINVAKGKRMNRNDWKDIVSRMRANGCDITDKEAAIIVDYLAKEYGN